MQSEFFIMFEPVNFLSTGQSEEQFETAFKGIVEELKMKKTQLSLIRLAQSS